MTINDWVESPARFARAVRHIRDTDGSYVKPGEVGEVCDYDTVNGYVIVDFAATGPILCVPDDIKPS